MRDGKLDEALPVIHRFLDNGPTLRTDTPCSGLFSSSNPGLRRRLREYGEAAKLRPPSAFESKIMGLSEAMLNDYASADLWLSRSLAAESP